MIYLFIIYRHKVKHGQMKVMLNQFNGKLNNVRAIHSMSNFSSEDFLYIIIHIVRNIHVHRNAYIRHHFMDILEE